MRTTVDWIGENPGADISILFVCTLTTMSLGPNAKIATETRYMRLQHHRIKLTSSRACEQFRFSHCLPTMLFLLCTSSTHHSHEYASNNLRTKTKHCHFDRTQHEIVASPHSSHIGRTHTQTAGARSYTHTRILVKSISVMGKRKILHEYKNKEEQRTILNCTLESVVGRSDGILHFHISIARFLCAIYTQRELEHARNIEKRTKTTSFLCRTETHDACQLARSFARKCFTIFAHNHVYAERTTHYYIY